MTKKKEIYNQYAIEQGYESWEHLIISTIQYYGYKDATNHITTLFNAVTDLIQEELLNKVTENVKNLLESEKVGEIFIEDYQLILKAILNTEIL